MALLAVNVIIFSVFTQIIGIFYILAQILVIGIVFVLNFLVNRTFTFSDEHTFALASAERKTSGGK